MEVAAAVDDGVILRSGAPDGTPEADGFMRPLLQDAGIGVQSGFTVYLDAAANRLIYFKSGCGDADAAARFFLHVHPVNHNDLPLHSWAFHNLDFDFDRHGFHYRGRCVAIRDLPDYRIAYLATGQFTPRDGQLWNVTLTEPRARRDFAVHWRGNTLVYLKEPCAAEDVRAQFFLRLRPAAAEGFDHLEFDFRDYGVAADGRCRAVVPLPAYEIAGIRTGQQAAAGGEPLWAAEFTASRPPPAPPELTIAKWFDDHAAAISITYDGVSGAPNRIDKLVLDEGLVLDYEIVTQRYLDQVPDWVEHDLTELVPDVVPGDLYRPMTDAAIEHSLSLTAHGFGFFGHGHWHVDHDALTYAQAYDSFRLCFEVMEDLGLEPVAYAYPRGAGGEAETQQALADAGFLAGRLSFPAMGQTPYIVPDAATTPENWFFLPGLTMESIRFRECEWCINDTSELVPVLDQALARTAWIIPVYHNIGSAGWGFYEWEDFEGDVRAIAARDFWVAPMNDVVLYLRERERAEAALQVIERDGVTRRIAFVLADGLDNDRFDQPLTLRFRRAGGLVRSAARGHPERPLGRPHRRVRGDGRDLAAAERGTVSRAALLALADRAGLAAAGPVHRPFMQRRHRGPAIALTAQAFAQRRQVAESPLAPPNQRVGALQPQRQRRLAEAAVRHQVDHVHVVYHQIGQGRGALQQRFAERSQELPVGADERDRAPAPPPPARHRILSQRVVEQKPVAAPKHGVRPAAEADARQDGGIPGEAGRHQRVEQIFRQAVGVRAVAARRGADEAPERVDARLEALRGVARLAVVMAVEVQVGPGLDQAGAKIRAFDEQAPFDEGRQRHPHARYRGQQIGQPVQRLAAAAVVVVLHVDGQRGDLVGHAPRVDPVRRGVEGPSAAPPHDCRANRRYTRRPATRLRSQNRPVPTQPTKRMVSAAAAAVSAGEPNQARMPVKPASNSPNPPIDCTGRAVIRLPPAAANSTSDQAASRPTARQSSQ